MMLNVLAHLTQGGLRYWRNRQLACAHIHRLPNAKSANEKNGNAVVLVWTIRIVESCKCAVVGMKKKRQSKEIKSTYLKLMATKQIQPPEPPVNYFADLKQNMPKQQNYETPPSMFDSTAWSSVDDSHGSACGAAPGRPAFGTPPEGTPG